MSVAVHNQQAAFLARSSREISQTVRIDFHSFLSRVRISVWPSKFCIGEKKPKWAQKPCVQLITRSHLKTVAVAVYNIDCEQNGDTSKHWVSTGPTASQSTCHNEDNHWADIYAQGRDCAVLLMISPSRSIWLVLIMMQMHAMYICFSLQCVSIINILYTICIHNMFYFCLSINLA